MQNAVMLRKLVNELGKPFVKMLGLPIVGKYNEFDECLKWIKSQTDTSKYHYYYDSDLDKYSIFEILPIADTQITNALLMCQFEKQITKLGKIHFWVKFWSVLTLIGCLFILIAILANS